MHIVVHLKWIGVDWLPFFLFLPRIYFLPRRLFCLYRGLSFIFVGTIYVCFRWVEQEVILLFSALVDQCRNSRPLITKGITSETTHLILLSLSIRTQNSFFMTKFSRIHSMDGSAKIYGVKMFNDLLYVFPPVRLRQMEASLCWVLSLIQPATKFIHCSRVRHREERAHRKCRWDRSIGWLIEARCDRRRRCDILERENNERTNENNRALFNHTHHFATIA